jgi:hypothetical protein
MSALAGTQIKPATAEAIHRCSERVARQARREHQRMRAGRVAEVQRVDSLTELPPALQAELRSGGSSAPRGGVKMNARGLDTGIVVVSDPDGHKHRTAPKRSGEYLNLLCAARGGHDREFNATTFLDGAPIANSRVSCRAHGPWRSTHVAKVNVPGLYEIHLNGAGFDDFILRTRGRPG